MPQPPRIEFPGTIARVAVLALDGARGTDLRRALGLARRYDRAPRTIAVDGGLAAFSAIRLRPDLVAGDLDSAGPIPRGVPVRRYPTAKAFNDFSGALREARRGRAGLIVVAGLLGGRLDHEWANLFEAGRAAAGFAGVIADEPRALVVVTAAALEITLPRGATLSLFAVGGPARVTLAGTRWPLARRRLDAGAHGLSNVATGTVALAVHSGVAALVVPSRNSKTSRATRARSSTTVP
jgi:thiamine pyrophosphokinase